MTSVSAGHIFVTLTQLEENGAVNMGIGSMTTLREVARSTD